MISDDEKGRQFADEVWINELKEIRPDGTVPAELARQRRALIYHQLAANGLLLLRNVRRALGAADDPSQIARLERLLKMVGNSLCDPWWDLITSNLVCGAFVYLLLLVMDLCPSHGRHAVPKR